MEASGAEDQQLEAVSEPPRAEVKGRALKLRRRRRGRITHQLPDASTGALTDASECFLTPTMTEENLLALSYERYGCRVVQRSLSETRPPRRAELLKAFHGAVKGLACHKHGNFVVQAIIKEMPYSEYAFIMSELADDLLHVSRNIYGCRVISRLLEKQRDWRSLRPGFMQIIFDSCLHLCRTPYGHHVIEVLLQTGSSRDQRVIVQSMAQNLEAVLENRSAVFTLCQVFRSAPCAVSSDILKALHLMAGAASRLSVHGRCGLEVISHAREAGYELP